MPKIENVKRVILYKLQKTGEYCIKYNNNHYKNTDINQANLFLKDVYANMIPKGGLRLNETVENDNSHDHLNYFFRPQNNRIVKKNDIVRWRDNNIEFDKVAYRNATKELFDYKQYLQVLWKRFEKPVAIAGLTAALIATIVITMYSIDKKQNTLKNKALTEMKNSMTR